MRRGHGLFTSLLMVVPIVAVPLMAVFGIPDFVPLSASPREDSVDAGTERSWRDVGVGQSAAAQTRPIELPQADRLDLFEPYSSRSSSGNAFVSHADGPVGNTAPRPAGWFDPLRAESGSRARDAVSRPALPTGDETRFRGNAPRSVNTVATPDTVRAGQSQVLTPASSRIVDDGPSTTGVVQAAARFEHASQDRQRFDGRSGADSADPEAEPLTWRTARDRLKQLGIRNYRLSEGHQPGTYHFVALVTSVDDPRVSRRFEAEADAPLDAVSRVLRQVEDWNSMQ